jgi:hypothetical protein
MQTYVTRFGSLSDYDKGGVDAIDDDPRHYAFSNIYEVASNARPWEKVAVARNQQYVLEVIRAEGTSEWRTCAHDEFALVMDGEITVELAETVGSAQAPPDHEGSIRLAGEPTGRPMGRIVARRGHMALLPANAAYRLHAAAPAALLLQTIAGGDTVERWAEICQTT